MNDALLQRFAQARSQYIASYFKNLNDMQLKAVMTTEGPLLLLAGAGSGKTTVLINRIANLIRFGRGSDTADIPDTVTEEDVYFLEDLVQDSFTATDADHMRANYLCAVEPAAPHSIMAITFTNKAANELKERLVAMLGDDAQSIWAMTFHSACCRILRRDIERLGFTRSFTIYDTSDSERIMKEIIKSMNLDDKTFPAKYVLSVISREKDRMNGPEEMLEQAGTASDDRLFYIAKAYQAYQTRLKENNALDFDDIIWRTVELLRDYEDVRAYYQRKFRYILVDEYQDTNNMQYLLTAYLAGGYENICVVGDDDQSIYRFRGATIENILNFEKQYRGARLIRLEQNYRSTQSILKAANSVIAHNLGRKGKQLWTANKEGSPITVYEAGDEGAEANYVAGQIISATRGKGFREHAILYRTNAQSNSMEYALRRNGIPYRVIGGTRFFDRAEIKDMLSYLCVINNRSDDLRLKRIINNPPRGIGGKTVELAERLSAAEHLPLYTVISNPDDYSPLEKVAGKLRAFTNMIEELAVLADEMTLPEFYDELMKRTGYAAALELKPTEENKTRLENIRELKSSIQAYVSNADIPTLAGFLEEVALYTDIEEYNADDDAVVMMTMHAAKGLEFPHVYLVGFEDGLFPGMRAIGSREEMEEERRLCYVAITRAMHHLTISHARQRMLYGKTSAALPSRFLKEIPEDIIARRGGYRSAPQSYSFGAAQTASYATKPQPKRESSYALPHSAPAAAPVWNKGDMVQHTAFGKGMILTVLKMGGDALLEIAFDEIGTKKLMANSASAHMRRL